MSTVWRDHLSLPTHSNSIPADTLLTFVVFPPSIYVFARGKSMAKGLADVSRSGAQFPCPGLDLVFVL